MPRRRLSSLRILGFVCVSLCTASPRAVAAEHWIAARTPAFELYTTGSEKQAAALLQEFEQVRSFFRLSGTLPDAAERPVRIVAFTSEKEYEPYRLNAGAFAYYVRNRYQDYIVLEDLATAHHEAAIHEYTHLVNQHLNLRLPVWLNEGVADLYSSLERDGQKVLVGRSLPGRMATLRRARWIDWQTLFAADSNSPYYNESDKMSIFYAQSWALTHMLKFSPAYRAGYNAFVTAVSEGAAADQALSTVYSKSVRQIDADLRAYVAQPEWNVAAFDMTLSGSDTAPQISGASDYQTGVVLAGVLAARANTSVAAGVQLQALVSRYPQSAEIHESLGYLAWQQGRLVEAQTHFAIAVQQNGTDPRVVYEYAQLERLNGAPAEQIVPLLHKVLSLDPDHNEARLFLGIMEAKGKQFQLALATLSRLRSIAPDSSYEYYSALAYCNLQLRNEEIANRFQHKALENARNASQREQALNMLKYFEPRETQLAARMETPSRRAALNN
jgi:tetratricopeptide (TPR) repeat protein